MELPFDLKNAIEKKATGIPQARLKKCAEQLTDMYKEESGKGKRLASDDISTLTYAIVRMPATFGAVSSALMYSLAQTDDDINTVLDVGSGTGTAVWACTEVIESLEHITCLEREPSMLNFAKDLIKDSTFSNKVSWINGDICTYETTSKFDLVVASYCLNELTERDREKVIEKLWDITGKILLIVEPGTPVAFAQIKKARETVISMGGFVVAPCAHSNTCTIDENDWCHFSSRIARTKLHKALKSGDVPYEDEKYSYIALTKSNVICNNRILRHPLIESGKITMKLCTPDGIVIKSVTKKQKDLFKKARKVQNGDTF